MVVRWLLPVVLAAVLVIVGLWGYNQYQQNMEYSNYMENLYQKSFYELVGQVGDIETKLSKLMVSGDQGQSMIILSDVWRQADAAQINLGQLPLGHLSLIRTSKFMNQLADYCYYLTKKTGQAQMLLKDIFKEPTGSDAKPIFRRTFWIIHRKHYSLNLRKSFAGFMKPLILRVPTASVIRLMGALLIEQDERRQTGYKYFDMQLYYQMRKVHS